MKKGEIWLVDLFGTFGREQSGFRPAIVITESPANIVIVVPLTSNLKSLKIPFVLEIDPSENNGLNAVSAALVFQLRAIDKNRLTRKLGELEKTKFKDIKKMIKRLFDLK